LEFIGEFACKLTDKLQFVDNLKINNCRAGACSCRQTKTERASPFPTNPTFETATRGQEKRFFKQPHLVSVVNAVD